MTGERPPRRMALRLPPRRSSTAEQWTLNPLVEGSNPSVGTPENPCIARVLCFWGAGGLSALIILWFATTGDGMDWKVVTTASLWRQLSKYLACVADQLGRPGARQPPGRPRAAGRARRALRRWRQCLRGAGRVRRRGGRRGRGERAGRAEGGVWRRGQGGRPWTLRRLGRRWPPDRAIGSRFGLGGLRWSGNGLILGGPQVMAPRPRRPDNACAHLSPSSALPVRSPWPSIAPHPGEGDEKDTNDLDRCVASDDQCIHSSGNDWVHVSSTTVEAVKSS